MQLISLHVSINADTFLFSKFSCTRGHFSNLLFMFSSLSSINSFLILSGIATLLILNTFFDSLDSGPHLLFVYYYFFCPESRLTGFPDGIHHC